MAGFGKLFTEALRSIYLQSVAVFVYPRIHGYVRGRWIGVRNLKGK
jgi:hypothetical protein